MLRRRRYVLRPEGGDIQVRQEQEAVPPKRLVHPRAYPPPRTFAQAVAKPREDAPERCALCNRPTAARAGKGLSLTHCRYHVRWRNRHGSYWKGTYTAAQLSVYRKTAARYLGPRAASDFWMAHALVALRGTLDGAGPVERAVDAKRMKPKQKARAVLARARANVVPPLRLLVNYLAVAMAVAEDPVQPGADRGEYRLTQIGKVVHRMASGEHSVYGPGLRYDRYARSSGLALRHLGRMIEGACELVRDNHLAALLAHKAKWYGGAPTK